MHSTSRLSNLNIQESVIIRQKVKTNITVPRQLKKISIISIVNNANEKIISPLTEGK